ncbi:ribonuclease H-like domain-containing protein [Tanacetum coccineum]
MTGNKSYLSDYEEIDGRFVAFGGSTKGGKITGKGKIRTGKLDFEDVYFVKELKFNLFSVSQMCDKKKPIVLFTGGLICLFAKATLDESNLWHRRLGHINFKTMNKLVRGNLVSLEGADRDSFVGYSVVLGSRPEWLFDIDTLTKSMMYKPVLAGNLMVVQVQKNVIMQAKLEWRQMPKIAGNKDSEMPNTEEPRLNQEKDENVNSTNNINTVSSPVNAAGIEDNVVDKNIVIGCADDPNMPNLEEIVYSDDEEGVGVEADMTNLDTNIPVSPIPTTKIYKDHPVDQIIGDIHSAP